MTWFRKSSREQDLDRELKSHLEAESAEYREAGMPRDRAAHEAHRTLGNRELIKEQVREAWGWVWVDHLLQDLRYALRGFAKTPGFTAIVIVTLGLGIGANTAMFSVLDAVILRPLPYRDAKQLIAIWQLDKHDRSTPPFFNNYNDFQAFRGSSRVFDEVAAATWATPGRTFSGRGIARDVLAMPVSINFFSLLGRSPALGRAFQPADLSRGCTVVLKNSFWRNYLNSSPDAIGGQIHLDDDACTVIGVMPPDVTFFPDALSMWVLITPLSPIARDPEHAGVGVFARLRPGVSIDAAQKEIERVFTDEHKNDRLPSERAPFAYSLQEQFAYLTGPNLRLTLVVLFAAVCFVLLIACLNVANLLLARFASRYRELALRTALGCRRSRLIRQLLTESLLLAGGGALLGIVVASLAVHAFNVSNPVRMPPGTPVLINRGVLLYTSGLAILTTVLFGLIPALRATRVDISETLKAAGKGISSGITSQRLARILIAVEITLSLVLLVGASLLIGSLDRLTSTPLGFVPDRIFSFDVTPPARKYKTAADRQQMYAKVLRVARHVSGGRPVELASSLPAIGGRWGGHVLAIDGRSLPDPEHGVRDAALVQITPGYFHLMGVPLLHGRSFTDQDRFDTQAVVIVNQALARKYFSNESPIGRRIRFQEAAGDKSWWTIVGVVTDEKQSDFFHEMSWNRVPCVFRPIEQDPPGSLDVITRVLGKAVPAGEARVDADLRQSVASLDPLMPVGDIDTLTIALAHLRADARFRSFLLATFAAMSLLLASVGLYGVLTHLVRLRTREIGVRMALGAQRRHVVLMIVNQSMLLVGIGTGAGLAISWYLTRFLASLLYGVTSSDPGIFAGVVFTLAAVAFAASYLPARRAATVDPSTVLRYE